MNWSFKCVVVAFCQAFVVLHLCGCLTAQQVTDIVDALNGTNAPPAAITNVVEAVTNAVPDKPADPLPQACSCRGMPCAGNPAHKSAEGGTSFDGISDLRCGADADESQKYNPFGKRAAPWMCVTRPLVKAGAISTRREGSDLILEARCTTIDGIRYHALGFTLESSSNPFLCPETRPDIVTRVGDTLQLRIVGGKTRATTRVEFVRVTPK